MSEAVYGYCPFCHAPGVSRERRINGNDLCSNGHKYPSSSSSKKEENKPLPSWVSRAREMIISRNIGLDMAIQSDNQSIVSIHHYAITALEELLKAEGYGVNDV